MKLHLPITLRRSLVALFSAFTVSLSVNTAVASIGHADVSQVTYTDFGQNMGRYKAGNTNAMLQYIRERDGGVVIEYLGGQEPFIMPHGMISFESATEGGYAAVVENNFLSTCAHNGTLNPTLTDRYVGSNNSIYYQGIEVSRSATVFRLYPGADHKIERLSKLVTDVTTADVYSSGDGSSYNLDVNGQYIYRCGGGYQQHADYEGNMTWYAGAYAYITGGITSINGVSYQKQPGTLANNGIEDDVFVMGASGVGTWDSAGINELRPLPFSTQGGDSGSPIYIWDERTQSYVFFSSHYARGGWNTYSTGAHEWTANTIASYNKNVDLSGTQVVHIGAVDMAHPDQELVETATGIEASTIPWTGNVTSDDGTVLTDFRGVQQGLNTWKSLTDVKDLSNWYHYDSSYLNTEEVTIADLFVTENLIFKATNDKNYDVVLDADVDLGVGYMQFSAGEQESAQFTLTDNGKGYNISSAGYIVDKGVSLYVNLINTDADYMREWRKIGEGDMHLVGTGNNQVMLNLGGAGATYLDQKNGYAAYNVLANNGTTVVISGIGQIERDFTFGNGGAVLDMNGNDMDWYYTNDNISAAGFSINALTEDAIIANNKGQATITFKQSGAQTYLGSFRDTENSSLRIVYDAGADSTWTLNSVYTNLVNENSGLDVRSGTVTLSGINTVHAQGSVGNSAGRYFNEDDWHYADATMNVNVLSNATFELGSHARLIGDITVEGNGVFIMREGVKYEFEYLEGGLNKESTYGEVANYYGLKGNVVLSSADSNMQIAYSEGTTADHEYHGNISGLGNVSIDLGTNGSALTISGNNTFSGAKNLISGGLIATGESSLGDVSAQKWVIGEKAWLAADVFTGSNALNYIDGSSSGVLALGTDVMEEIRLDNHKTLIIGAQEGKSVEYGTADVTLNAYDNKWVLGGGGGNLIVNFKLSGANDLVLGNQYGHGTVTLTNAENDFTGQVKFAGGVTLDYASLDMLGQGKVDLTYASRIFAYSGVADKITTSSDGVLLLDRAANAHLDMSDHTGIFLGANEDMTYKGQITLATGASYRFGGLTGTMTVESALESGHALMLDGQGYSGGKVVLGENAKALNSGVIIQGQGNASQSKGDITLALKVDDALVNNSYILISEGGILDLNGTTQSMLFLQASSGSAIVDSVGGGLLKIYSWSSMYGNVDVTTIEKYDNSNLVLGGQNAYETFSIIAGSVSLASNTALYENGVLNLSAGTKLDTEGYRVSGNVTMNDASIGFGSRDDSNPLVNGDILVMTGTNNVLTNSGSKSVTLNGHVSLAENTKLTIKGGTFRTIADMGGTNAIIDYQAGKLDMGLAVADEAQTIKGTLLFANAPNGQATIYSYGSVDNQRREFEHIQIESGNTLNFTEASWNTVWQIDKLSGDGNMTWNSTASHWFSSRLILTGENDFSGTIALNRNRSEVNANRVYAAYLELAHDQAAQKSDISLSGNSADNVASLAINTDNARVKGLDGNEHTYLYAGAAFAGGGENNDSMGVAPEATRQASLTITGEGTHTFDGQVGTANDGSNGLRLVMSGTGNQTFSGSSLNVTGVEVQSGTLTLNSTGLNVGNDISIAQGGTLNLSADGGVGSWSLDAGKTLNMQDSQTSNAAAVYVGGLVLNGGDLSFSGAAMSGETAMLDISNGSVSLGSITGQTVNFYDTASLNVGTYYLSAGDWSALKGQTITATGLKYLNASFIVTDGLRVTFTSKDGNFVWDGTDASGEWTADKFGQQGVTMSDSQVAVFNDSAANKKVQITASGTVGALLFDSHEDYAVSSIGDAVIEAKNLEHTGSGTTTLESGVTVTGAAKLVAGELVVKSFDTLQGEISGAGTLTLDAVANAQGSLNVNGLANLHIAGGRYDAVTAVNADAIRVTDGGQLSIAGGVTQDKALYISGADVDGVSAPLELGDKAVLSGSLTLEGDAAIKSAGDYSLTGALDTGNYQLSKTGTGTLKIESGAEVKGNIDVLDGKLVLSGDGHRYASLNSIDLAEGTNLTVEYGVGLVGTDISMAEGATLQLRNGGGSNNHVEANIITHGNATIRGSIFGDRTNLGGTVTGQGTLTLLSDGQYANVWRLNSNISDAEGQTLTLATNGTNVIITGFNSYTGGTSINGGSVQTANLYALGKGDVSMNNTTLTLNDELVVESLSGNGTVNLNGRTLNIDGAKSLTFTGTVTGNGVLYKTGEGTQSFTGGSTLSGVAVNRGGLVLSGSTNTLGSMVAVNRGASLSVGNVRVERKETVGGVVDDDVAASLIYGAVSTVTENGASQTVITAAEDGAMAEMNHMLIIQTADDTLKLDGVKMSANSQVQGGNIVIDDLDLQIQAGTNMQAVGESQLATGTELLLTGGTDESIVLNFDLTVLEVACSGFLDATISGSLLTLNFDGIEEHMMDSWLDGDFLLSLEFSDGGGVSPIGDDTEDTVKPDSPSTLNLDGMTVIAKSGESALNVYTTQVDGVQRLFIGNVVPEPGTASLSLLGPVALMLRRRRK